MARALRAWAINRGGKNSLRNLRYGPRTRLVRGIYSSAISASTETIHKLRLQTLQNNACSKTGLTALLSQRLYTRLAARTVMTFI